MNKKDASTFALRPNSKKWAEIKIVKGEFEGPNQVEKFN